jgi:tetratricopeptide (TPR) repeat protein
MAAYGSGGKHDPFERFVEYFVGKAKDPGVKTYEDFEKRWKEWILALHALHFGDGSAADTLIARGRKQLAAKKSDAARESYRWALRKRPGDVTALVELGDLLAAQKELDSSLYYYRKALIGARGAAQASPAVVERSTKQIAALDEDLGKALGAAETKLLASCGETAQAYVDKEFPRAALRLLERAGLACGGSKELTELRESIEASSGADTRRWRRPRLENGLSQWELGDGWQPDGEALFGKTSRVSFATWKEPLPERYRLEVRWKAVDLKAGGFVAVTFGAGDGGLQYFGVSDDGIAEVGRLTKKWEPLEPIGLVPKEALGSLEIAIDVAPEKTSFSMNGKVVLERAYSPDELAGRVGLVLQNGSAGFEGLRVRY